MAVVDVQHLMKRYGDQTAVADVSLTVEAGEIFGILGHNGAGKTTTVECISGLRSPNSGQISVLGLDPIADRQKLHHLVGVQLQDSRLPERMTVAQALDLFASLYPDPVPVATMTDRFGLGSCLRQRFGQLSGGQRQRLSVALALIGRPRLAILDELTTGLDPRARRDTWDVVRQAQEDGVTVVLVSHLMDEVERLCDRVALLRSGRITAIDTPAGLVARVSTGTRLVFRLPDLPPNGDSGKAAGLLLGLPGVEAVSPRWELSPLLIHE